MSTTEATHAETLTALEQSIDEGPVTEDEYKQYIQSLAPLPRSERVAKLFNFQATDYQTDLLDLTEDTDRTQAAPKAGRQVGKTLTAGVLGADHAVMHPGTDVLYAAPAQSTADEMFRECKAHFKNSRFSLSRFGVTADNKQTWEFDTGTRILARTLGNVEQEDSPGNRGMNPTCVIVDEAAYEKDAVYVQEIEEFFITHPSYEYYLFSTPAGKSGYFYNAVEGNNADDWFSPHWPTRISPYAQQDYIEKKRRQLDSQTFSQEFLGEFIDDGGSAIPHEVLTPNITPDAPREALADRYLGIDPARSGKDEMVVTDMDETGVCWNIWSFETINGPRFVELLEILHQHKNTLEHWPTTPQPEYGSGQTPSDGYQRILIEENGVGGFAADFAEAGLGDVIRVVNSTNETKQNVYQRLIADLEDEQLALPNHRTLIRQTTNLEKSFTPTGKAKYEAPSGKRDDWADSLGFSNWARHGNGDRLDVKTQRREPSNRGVRSF